VQYLGLTINHKAMPCLGDSWDTDLTPGTTGYAIADKVVQEQLDRLVNVVNFYCRAYDRDFPIDFPNGHLFRFLHEDDQRLLIAIHHHLRCDGIKANETMDIWSLTRMHPEKYSDKEQIAKDCYRLSRMGGLIRKFLQKRVKTMQCALNEHIEDHYRMAKSGQWEHLLKLWLDSPLLANRCSRYSHPKSRWTFLHQAAYFGHQDGCCALIAKGALVDALTREHRSPLEVAEQRGHSGIAALLRDASLGQSSLWEPSPDPDILPSSNRWKSSKKIVASVDLFTMFDGRIIRIAKGDEYYEDYYKRVLINSSGGFVPESSFFNSIADYEMSAEFSSIENEKEMKVGTHEGGNVGSGSDEPEVAEFQHKALLININQSSKKWSLYDATRYAWKIDPQKASQAEVILATIHGLIVGAFVADEWLEATSENFLDRAEDGGAPSRYGFIGKEAHEDIRKLYVGKLIPGEYQKKGAQNPIRYTWKSGPGQQ
jgi:hypothetical protein